MVKRQIPMFAALENNVKGEIEMKIALIVVGIIIVIGVVFEIWSKIAYRRWRKRFDALPPDERRKEQERMYKVRACVSWE